VRSIGKGVQELQEFRSSEYPLATEYMTSKIRQLKGIRLDKIETSTVTAELLNS
jgi:hypothetical protein